MRTRIGRAGTEIWTASVPTKYPANDLDWVDLLKTRTGLSRAEIIRRSVRYLAAQAAKNPKWNWIEETAKPLDPLPPELKAEITPQDDEAKPARGKPRAS
jgi:hypothetical protein